MSDRMEKAMWKVVGVAFFLVGTGAIGYSLIVGCVALASEVGGVADPWTSRIGSDGETFGAIVGAGLTAGLGYVIGVLSHERPS